VRGDLWNYHLAYETCTPHHDPLGHCTPFWSASVTD
jgi:hypothetical protein